MGVTLAIIGLIFSAIGVIFVFDARKLTKNIFSVQDINDGTKYLKIFGWLIFVLGLGITYVCLPKLIEILK